MRKICSDNRNHLSFPALCICTKSNGTLTDFANFSCIKLKLSDFLRCPAIRHNISNADQISPKAAQTIDPSLQ